MARPRRSNSRTPGVASYDWTTSRAAFGEPVPHRLETPRAAASNRIEQTREFLAAGKRENDVDTIGRELECHSLEVITPSVGGGVRAETAHERGAVSP